MGDWNYNLGDIPAGDVRIMVSYRQGGTTHLQICPAGLLAAMPPMMSPYAWRLAPDPAPEPK